MREFNDSTGIMKDEDQLREAAERDGYIFFREMIEPEALLRVRKEILAICERAGWLADGSNPMEGIARPGLTLVEPQPDFMAVYDAVQRLESFHDLAHHPCLLDALDRLFGEKTLVHPRNIARIIFPNNTPYTTPAHQDYIHIRGTAETWTAWIPLGDCPKSCGSLAVMAGSHKSGIFETHPALGAGGQGIDTEGLPFEWHASDFSLGDVLLFHSHAVHRALPNENPERLRLSVDYRYQPVSHPVTQGSLLPHYARYEWDELYDGWSSGERQYYWKGLALNVVE